MAAVVALNGASVHETVLAEILAALPAGAEVRLIGRVSDPAIANPSAMEVYLFVPDLHLLSAAATQRYKYKFNHEDDRILARILERMTELRERWKSAGPYKLVTVQLGDFFDTWREGTRDVQEAHAELRDLLYRGGDISPMKPYLNATMLLGNHDTLQGMPLEGIKFLQKWFNRVRDSSGEKPFLFATHGDAFDILEKTLGDPFQEFAVYWLGPLHGGSTRSLGDWALACERYNAQPGAMSRRIQADVHDLRDRASEAITVLPGNEGALPAVLAQTITDPQDAAHGFFRDVYASLALAGQGSHSERITTFVIGHTHHARMVFLNAPGQRPLLLIDAGAWIEKCRYRHAGKEVEEPNAQIAVLHANDARLYQISIRKRE